MEGKRPMNRTFCQSRFFLARFDCRGSWAALRRLACLGALLVVFPGCSCEDATDPQDSDARDPVTGLTEAEAKEVLVKVGTHEITLGQFAATLLRMDRYERLRYQTEERQKLLLDEMVEVELLAQEAERRGLDKDPEVRQRLDQALRDELLRRVEQGLVPLDKISEREVREYYEAHRDEFREPERRRVLWIEVGKESTAHEVQAEASGASGQKWGELALKYNLERSKVGQNSEEAPELSGDQGFVSAPGQTRGENPAIPPEVRRAVFGLEKVGDVVPEVIQSGDLFYIVRLGGISPARDRTAVEADRAIRVELRRQKYIQAEKDLEAELRKKYPVKIDAQAIRAYTPPSVP